MENETNRRSENDDFPEERECFNALFARCRDSIYRLESEWREAMGAPLLGASLLATLPKGDVFLPDHCLPFEGVVPPSAFDQSFFNVFNYDHGTLNAHVDRGLLTVVTGYTKNSQHETSSRLWIRDLHTRRWIDAEAECARHSANTIGDNCDYALLFGGEQLERLTGGRVSAIEHCVRVDPDGVFLNRSHHTRDPAAQSATGNRLSAAMIFSFREEEKEQR